MYPVTLHVCKFGLRSFLHVQGVCKMLGQTSAVSFPQYDEEESSYQYLSVCKQFSSYSHQHVNLSALDFCLWRHVTTPVCSAAIEYEETLHQRNFDSCQTIRNRPGTLETARYSMLRRACVCIDSGGRYVEHLL